MKTHRWIALFDRHGLFAISLFLLFFIPLFPKLPLLDAIPGYLVRVRIEDFLVFFAGVVWLIQVFRGKVNWNHSYFWLVGAYAVVGLASIVSAVVLLTSVPVQPVHVGKSALHYLRYLEYFSLFFFAYSGTKTRTHLKIVAASIAVIVVAISLYGLGQKYWGWPVYSTMNREFSKGIQLQLTEFARVQSTFAGHYDLAAFMVLVLPLLLALTLYVKSLLGKCALVLAQLGGVAMLLLSGSKTAFIAYGAGLMTLGVLLVKARPKWWKPLLITSGLLVVMTVVSLALALTVFRPSLVQLVTQVQNSTPVKRSQTLTQVVSVAANIISPSHDLVPTDKPTDVYVDVPDYVRVASQSAIGEEYFIIQERERTWSKNAQKYGLSMAIRLDTLWPQAVTGFLINPYLGKGYGTLNKQAYNEFTEADSTDNNFLRTLGETGLLGFIVFYCIVLLTIRDTGKNLSKHDLFIQVLSQGFIAGAVGLLVNALIIDVFTASKVAFAFWALAGFIVKSYHITQPAAATELDLKRRQNWLRLLKKHWVIGLFVLFLGALIHQYPFAEHSLVRNMAIDPNQVAHIKIVTCLKQSWQWSNCRAQLITNQQISPLYTAVILPFYFIQSDPMMFYFANVLLSLASLWLFYLLSQKVFKSSWQINLSLALYVLNPWTYRYPLAPVSSNLILLLTLALAWVGVNLQKRLRVLYAIGIGVLIALSYAGMDASLLLVLVPVLAILITGLNRFTPFMINKKFQLVAGGIVFILVAIWPIGLVQQIVENFRFNAPEWRYLAVKRANTLFSAPLEPNKQPTLITALNPDYIDLFSNHQFQVSPLKDDALTYQSLIRNSEKTVYLTNADITTTNQAWFNAMRQLYQLQLVEIDCQYQCDFYRVLPEPLPFSFQPISINKKMIEIASGQPYSFTVYSHQFKQALQVTNTLPYSTYFATEKMLPVIAQPTNFAFFTGEFINRQDAGHFNYFMKNIGLAAQFPIIHVPGEYHKQNLFDSSYQSFQIGSQYFLAISPQADNSIGRGQEIFIRNELLKLEKHPEIKEVFVFYYGLGWLLEQPAFAQLKQLTNGEPVSPADTFVSEVLAPALMNFSDKKIFMLSGDIKHETSPSILFDQLPESNITVVASGVSNRATDVYLIATVEPSGLITFTPISVSNQSLQPIENYNLNFWENTLK